MNVARKTVILDIDGTLAITNFHRAPAWFRALSGVVLPPWRRHRHIGMGGDHLVASPAGDEVERNVEDDIRSSEETHYRDLIDEVYPMTGH
jgi:beta-phosphoglucomutase-like phosphatase (HAD superfamily)